MVCIVVVLAMSYWVTRLVAGTGIFHKGFKRRTDNGQIEVLDQELLGKDQRLVVARVSDKYYLLGVTPNAISLISEISWDETSKETDASRVEEQTPPSFGEAFTTVLKQKLRR